MMRFIYVFVPIILFNTFLFSQQSTHTIDSLSRLSTKQLNAYYDSISSTKDVLLYTDAIIQKGRKEQNLELVAHGYYKKAYILSSQDDPNTIPYINHAIAIAKDSIHNDSLTHRYLLSKGVILYDWGSYKNALDNYLVAYKYYEKVDNEVMILAIQDNIALLKIAVGDFNESLEILKKNNLIYKDSTHSLYDKNSHLSSLIAITDAYLKKYGENEPKDTKLLDSAAFYNTTGLQKSSAYKDSLMLNYFQILQAIILYERKDFHGTIQEMNTLKEDTKKLKLVHNYSTIDFYLGKAYYGLQQYDEAEFHLKKTDSLSLKKSFNYSVLQETYLLLSQLAFKKKDIVAYKKYVDLSQENDKRNEKIDIAIRNKYNEKFKIEPLESLNKTLLSSNKLQKIILGISFICICFLIYLLYKYKRRQKENRVAFESLLQQMENPKKPTVKSAQKLKINDEKVAQILQELTKFEEKKLFLGVQCNVDFVAKKAKTNKAYLSKVIHTHKQQTFIEYITKLRIDYVLERLKNDSLFRTYDIKSIATELGYKSQNSFSKAFKLRTGIYPSYYIKNLDKMQDEA
ncbi:AraC family transcriptional regulator [uncultured Kordia sp.]|uniref:helix-turn-helix domain-containing protein n=1 Tax=uncultured Kordia sp. TaxID=507699 RepID=UPI00260C8A05|nr:helix-turn-helix domain-containing protein [uncultured Kordia sp.]